MPNPYHDGTGRFCSKGEMRTAIEVALKDQKFDAYYQLRQDYEAASQESLTVTPIQKPTGYVAETPDLDDDDEPTESFTEKLILAGNSGRLLSSLDSESRASRIAADFAKRRTPTILTETQLSLLSDSLYHINRAGYHYGVSQEQGYFDEPRGFDKDEASEHIVTRLGYLTKVYDETRTEIAKIADEAWEDGAGAGRWDV